MNIHVAVLNTGWIHVGLASVLLQLVATYRKGPLTIAFSGLGAEDRPIASNRSKIVKNVPADADVLVMIDSDCIPPPDFLDAADLDLDIVGLPMPIYRSGDICVGLNPVDGREMSQVGADEVIECSGIAGGVMFIARRVFSHPNMRRAFHDEFDADGVITATEDYVYCKHAIMEGFRVWAAMKYPLRHMKEVDLKRVWERRLDRVALGR